ncbi:hypothetical protein [Streptomyces sp. NPDC005181]|uniref:hypothetical protein n=1 Tax=Streptomyces sp. NPDC005181 TaxID=3156869 RepID=UPI0033AF91CD
MFADIGPLEVVTLIVLAVILVGPDKLPKMVSDTVRTLRKVRELSQSTQASIRDELPPELQNLTLEDLNPKALEEPAECREPEPDRADHRLRP